MSDIANIAIESVNKSKTSFCKFISANDAGKTGGHQEGFYIPKNSIPLMFDSPRQKGKNDERFITIKWQNDFETQSRFIYYGQGTRNEYRLTRFGRGFPFLTTNNVGDLFILSHIENDYYEGFVLQSDEDIEEFFAAFNISSNETNRLIEKQITITAEERLLQCFNLYLSTLKCDFPSTIDLATNARNCYLKTFNIKPSQIITHPDSELINWLNSEYQLFKTIENVRYSERIKTPFVNVEELVECANTILNRRKSRAGKSLEHHLAEVFNNFKLEYQSQVITEENKRPDFIFPNSVQYHNQSYPSDKLVFLASKTTCKDRWRQILNEADRIKYKYLFTLQQGISSNQLAEMYKYDVRLVVPQPYLSSFPEEYRPQIHTLNSFIHLVQEKQN
ncbi:restriction endonuclease EcoRII [Breznakibacter xylanolyticus]|uniref:Restriction endonuclease EcoRII n=1 Tax=Breznakibacter xylanolyticus TaxID=990 RepID=A0A2W7MUH6_9BACT|nr:type II restriction endonuclease [Breznakibacter xylanolyticus]PZX11688.1 restriction endonuclease EcoRII [Breznakibacter xylanolyticus]